MMPATNPVVKVLSQNCISRPIPDERCSLDAAGWLGWSLWIGGSEWVLDMVKWCRLGDGNLVQEAYKAVPVCKSYLIYQRKLVTRHDNLEESNTSTTYC